MRKNATNKNPITINGLPLDGVQEIVNLGSKMTTNGDCDQEINARISKDNQAVAMFRSTVWRSTVSIIQTKIGLFKSYVISVLLYGSEC